MAQSFDSILKTLKEGKFKPVYFFAGEEAYYTDVLVDFIAKNVLTEDQKAFNQVVMYGKDSDVNQIKNAVQRYPLMADRQVVIVKEAQELKKIEELQSYIENPVPTTLLVFAYKHKNLDKRTSFYKSAIKHTVFFESSKLKEALVPNWINEKFAEKGYSISSKGALLLSEFQGNNLEKLSNSIDRLVLGSPDKKNITEEDIEKNIGISKDYNLFELSDAIGRKDIVKATKIFNYFKSNPKACPMPLLIGTLFGFFSKLTVLDLNRKSAEVLKINPYVIQNLQPALNKYKGKTKQVMELIEEFDLRSKGVNDAGTPDGQLIEELIFRIMYL